jgi:hypothetical protein
MELLFRADFDFRNEKYGIKHCVGYVVCSDVEVQGENYTFNIKKVVVKKLIGNVKINRCLGVFLSAGVSILATGIVLLCFVVTVCVVFKPK